MSARLMKGRIPARLALMAAATALASLLAACGGTDSPARGTVLGNTVVTTVTKSNLDAAMAAATPPLTDLTGSAACDVVVREIVYATPGPKGGTYDVSAALLLPTNCTGSMPTPTPLVAYNRGTEVLKARAMANPADSETGVLMALLASQGYAVVATDYLGYNKSNHPYHPYLHADSQASTTIDSIRAARSVMSTLSVSTSGKLFLTGYSQGGHASLATLKAIQADASLGMTVAAAGPMSGPYSLTNSVLAGLAYLQQGGTGGSSVFTPFLTSAYQKIYGNLYSSPSEFYRAPYATGIEDLLPGTLSFASLIDPLSGKLPARLDLLITDTAAAAISNETSPIRKALAANDLITSWTPSVPLVLCAGSGDPVVLYDANTAVALEAFGGASATRFAVDVNAAMNLAGIAPLSEKYHVAAQPFCLKAVRDALFSSFFTQPG